MPLSLLCVCVCVSESSARKHTAISTRSCAPPPVAHDTLCTTYRLFTRLPLPLCHFAYARRAINWKFSTLTSSLFHCSALFTLFHIDFHFYQCFCSRTTFSHTFFTYFFNKLPVYSYICWHRNLFSNLTARFVSLHYSLLLSTIAVQSSRTLLPFITCTLALCNLLIFHFISMQQFCI